MAVRESDSLVAVRQNIQRPARSYRPYPSLISVVPLAKNFIHSLLRCVLNACTYVWFHYSPLRANQQESEADTDAEATRAAMTLYGQFPRYCSINYLPAL